MIRDLAIGIWIPALLLISAPPALSQGGFGELPPGKWWKERRVIEELRLSQDQQARIEALWMQNRRGFIDMKAEMDKRHLDLSDILARDSVDEAAALKAFEQVQAARLALERATFLMRVRIKNILTPEQQQRLEELAERIRRQRNPNRPAFPQRDRNQGPGQSPPPILPFDF